MTPSNGTMLASAGLFALLTLTGCESVVEQVADTYHTDLTGAQEVPKPGDPDGSGRFEVSISDRVDQFCYEFKDVRGIGTPTAAHIHRGASGVAGPVVVPLDPPGGGNSKGCKDVPEAIADEIKANPTSFYVNVHNAEFPDGAIRGQLRH
ncbi:MAG TPA: CHRD domain-containing protein [Rhizorhapis sp.]|nr:CHRD domain-containing protein [Rhizorhapis sp.]